MTTSERAAKIYCPAFGKTIAEMNTKELLEAAVYLFEEGESIKKLLFDAQDTNVQFMKDIVKLKTA